VLKDAMYRLFAATECVSDKPNLVIATDRRTYHLQLESCTAIAMSAIS
jgi:type IV secretory pathway VirB9-like protein